jgi:hypothetical protein
MSDLFDDHRALTAIADELLELVRQTPRPGLGALTQLRAQLGSRAAQHLRNEDATIIRPLFASGRINELPNAQEAIAAIRESRAQYSNHVGKWTLAAIQADWDGYARALTDMIDYLNRLIELEERDLYWPALHLLGQDMGPV